MNPIEPVRPGLRSTADGLVRRKRDVDVAEDVFQRVAECRRELVELSALGKKPGLAVVLAGSLLLSIRAVEAREYILEQ